MGSYDVKLSCEECHIKTEGDVEFYFEMSQSGRGMETAAVYVKMDSVQINLNLALLLEPTGDNADTPYVTSISKTDSVPLALVDQLSWPLTVAGIEFTAGWVYTVYA